MLKGVVFLVSGNLVLLASLPLGFDGSGSSLVSILFSLLDDGNSLLLEWVESVHQSSVGEWVSVGLVVSSSGAFLFSQLGLDLVGVDNSRQVSASHQVSVHVISLLGNGVSEVGSEEGVQTTESAFGEDDESSEVTTWSQLNDVKSVDVASVNSLQVSGSLLKIFALVSVDDEWAFLGDVKGVSHFTLACSSVSARFVT